MSTDLTRIRDKARRSPKLVFTSLYHHITDIDNLRDCYAELSRNKAAGIDAVSKEEYGKNLEKNLQNLSERMKRMGYVPMPKRRTYIPKQGSEKGRPLGISCFEDKIVELATKKVLELLFEPLFQACSYGYRPKLSPHHCLDELGRTIQQKRVNQIVEADIRGFFDNVNQSWLIRFLKQRVGDKRVIRLITRMLKAGVMENGITTASDYGTPQGSIVSPLLSNIYLHYVLDLWFEHRVKRQCKGEAYLFRFADDFLVCFQYKTDAEGFLSNLEARLEGFSLKLAEEKTRSLEFGRFARENARKKGCKPESFDFLGFTFYCGKTRHGAFKVKRRTSRKKLQQSLHRFQDWIRRMRGLLPTGELMKQAKRRIAGHLNYFAITDNTEMCTTYMYWVKRILFKWLNRRSQRQSYNWEGFKTMLTHVNVPRVYIRVNMNPFSKTPNVQMKSRMWESCLSGSVRG